MDYEAKLNKILTGYEKFGNEDRIVSTYIYVDKWLKEDQTSAISWILKQSVDVQCWYANQVIEHCEKNHALCAIILNSWLASDSVELKHEAVTLAISYGIKLKVNVQYYER